MTGHVREITKEQYDKVMQRNGCMPAEVAKAIFTDSELLGYGVYSPKVCEENGKYYVHYELGSSCN